MTDAELLQRFELADLDDFPHVSHVRAAWATLERDGEAGALTVMLDGIRRFAESKGVPGKFHYTVTRGWLLLIADARARHPNARSAAALIEACPLLADRHALDRFYSSGVLDSERARTTWVGPDRAPITSQPAASHDSREFVPDANPFTQFASAVERARGLGVDTAPVALATADAEGRPSVRMVLMRGADERGFVFHTNYTSRKARDLTENPNAALCLHWPALEEQIRIEGSVSRLPAGESDSYFASRARASQIGAWSSEQSAVLPDRAVLEQRIHEVEARFEGQDVPRPPFWGGFRIVPRRLEFWYGRDSRLHDRVVYLREDHGWRIERLFP